jgi:hypothetical protein
VLAADENGLLVLISVFKSIYDHGVLLTIDGLFTSEELAFRDLISELS